MMVDQIHAQTGFCIDYRLQRMAVYCAYACGGGVVRNLLDGKILHRSVGMGVRGSVNGDTFRQSHIQSHI